MSAAEVQRVPAQVHGLVPEDLYASWSPSLSPRAGQVAFVSDRSGVPEVWVRDLEGGEPTVVPLDRRRVTWVSWSPTGLWLTCLVAPPGASRTEVWVVRPDGSGARLVAGAAPGTAVPAGGRSHGWTRDGYLVVTETVHTGQVLRVDPVSGERVLLHEGDLTTAADVSADGRTLLLRVGPRGARQLLVLADGRLTPVVEPSGVGSSEHGCLAPDGQTAYARSDDGRDLAALVVLARAAGAPAEVFARPDGELEDVALSGDGTVAALTWNVHGGLSAVTLLDVATGRQRPVAPLPRPVVAGCVLSHDGSVLALTAQGPADPKGVWVLHVDARSFLAVSSPGSGRLHAAQGASREGIDPHDVVLPVLHTFTSDDGTVVSGWLYTPRGPAPHPTAIWLHGGPEAQERPVYNSLFQSLLAEGVAVFTPNVRGSSGFGRRFRTADDGAGRYGAFDDLRACAEHLVAEGLAAPGRLGLMGRSYGGYLTLAGLVRHPGLFALGVDVCGMSDLQTFYAHTEPWIAAAAVTKYGDPVRDADLLHDLSPMTRIDRLTSPLLVVHGADDTNVPLGEAEQVAAALSERGVPHRLLVFEGEGHELLGSASRIAFVQAVLDWVDRYL